MTSRAILLGMFVLMILTGMAINGVLATSSNPVKSEGKTSITIQIRHAQLQPIPSKIKASSSDFQPVSLLYPGQYHNSSQVEEELFMLNSTFPQLVELKPIGKSWQNKTIWAMIITNEEIPDDQKSQVLFVAEHHAREIITTEVSLRFILDLLNNFAPHEEIQFLLSRVIIHYIPVINPDGYDDVVNNEHYWQRKNGRPIDDDGDGQVDEDPLDNPSFTGRGNDDDGDGQVDEDPLGGVDLNRNYDFYWGTCPTGTSCNGDADEPTISSTYPGDAPFSEPETRAFRDYVANRTVAAALSYHSGTNATLFPWGYPGLPPPPDNDIFDAIKYQLRQYLPASYWINSVGYGVAGEWGDWYYATHGTITSTIEVYGNNRANDIYRYFNPEPNRIDALHEELIDFEYYWVKLAPILNVSVEIDPQGVLRVSIKNLSPALSTFEDINTSFQLIDGPNVNDVQINLIRPQTELLPAAQTVDYFVTFDGAEKGNYTLEISTGNEWTGRTSYQLQLTLEASTGGTGTTTSGTGTTTSGTGLSDTTTELANGSSLPTSNDSLAAASATTTPGFPHYIVVLSLGVTTTVLALTRRQGHKRKQ